MERTKSIGEKAAQIYDWCACLTREDAENQIRGLLGREPPAELSLDAKIKWFEEWVSDHAKKPSALEAEDYADMFDVINAAKGRISGVSKEGEE